MGSKLLQNIENGGLQIVEATQTMTEEVDDEEIHFNDNENCDEEFSKFLADNLNYQFLPINKNYTASSRLLKAYEYFNGIDEFIEGYFDIEGGEITPIQYNLVYQAVCEYAENLKR